MVTLLRRRRTIDPPDVEYATPTPEPTEPESPAIEIGPDDPLLGVLRDKGAPVDLDDVELESPALESLRAAGIKIVVPLITQGELIGTLNLGPRLSGQDYSRDDLKLLDSLASQAAPAVRVAQLIRQQEEEATERERLAQELRVARLIQHHFLPQQLPSVDGWDVEVSYRPAREVGGDFYDFIDLSDGRLGVVVADVTDKGVPAAMVMSATRTLLQATAQRLVEPAAVLGAVNDVMVQTVPTNMFITCLYGVLDPGDGTFRFANAGHNLPSVRRGEEVAEVRATGMPLGLMPGLVYEEATTDLAEGDALLLYSDGIVEAHSPDGEMFGFPRMRHCLEDADDAAAVVAALLDQLEAFTGPEWEQEDDVTIVALHRCVEATVDTHVFTVASVPGNEREATEAVGALLSGLGLGGIRLDQVKTATAEATMNAIEHGNRNDPSLDVRIEVRVSEHEITIGITDYGRGGVPIHETAPDIGAKLLGEQTPRGWGLFLIRSLVDDVRVVEADERTTIELVVRREGADDEQASL